MLSDHCHLKPRFREIHPARPWPILMAVWTAGVAYQIPTAGRVLLIPSDGAFVVFLPALARCHSVEGFERGCERCAVCHMLN